MKTRKSLFLLSVFLILSLVLAACAQATPAPEKIVETVIVEVEGEQVVQEKIITATPAAEEPAEEPVAEGGPIVVGEGKLVPCLPIPEIP